MSYILLQFVGAVRMERKGKLEEKSSSTYGTYRAIIFLGQKGKILEYLMSLKSKCKNIKYFLGPAALLLFV